MAKALPLPDGSTVTIREGETPEDTWERAKRMYPDAFGLQKEETAPAQQPQSGFTPALKAGIAGLKGDVAALAGRTGLMDEAAAEKYIQEQEEYKKKTFKPTETFGEAPFTKVKELLGGSLPYMAAPVAAGLAPGAAGLGLAGLASAAQFTGSNISRQMEEGKKLGQTELGSAALAAVPQAALDIVSFKMLPGIRGIMGAAGKQVTDAGAEQIAKQALSKVATDYAKATGTAMGAEGLTEAGQQVLERMQAGLNLTDEKARNEYWDSLIGGAVLGGALAPAGRYVERSKQAGQEAAVAKQARVAADQQAQQLADQQAAEKEAFKQTPEFVTQAKTAYDDLQKQIEELQKQANVKPAKNDFAAQADVREVRQKLSQLKASPEFSEAVANYRSVLPQIQAQEAQQVEDARRAEIMKQPGAQQDLFGAPEVQDLTPMAQVQRLADQAGELDAKIKAATTPQERQILTNQRYDLEQSISKLVPSQEDYAATNARLNQYVEQAQQNLADAKTPDEMQAALDSFDRYSNAQQELAKFKPFVAKTTVAAPKADANKLRNEIAKLQELGVSQPEDAAKLRSKLVQLKELERQPDFFSADTQAQMAQRDAEIANAIADSRQAREKVRNEVAGLQKIAAYKEPEFGSTAVKQARKERDLQQARDLLKNFDVTKVVRKGTTLTMSHNHNQDWQKLRLKPDSVEYQMDRERVRDSLQDEIKGLQKQAQAEQKAGTDTTNTNLELKAKQAALDDVQRRIELGQKYSRVTRAEEGPSNTQLINARVEDLIDRLLPRAVQPTEAPSRIVRAGEKRPVRQAPAPTAAQLSPIEAAQEQLTKLRGAQENLEELNERIQKAGRPTDKEKVLELSALKELREFLQRDIANIRATYNRASDLAQPRARAEEQADLFGPLEEVRGEANSIRADLKDLYDRRDQIKQDLTRRQQIAQTPQLQALVDKYSKDTPSLRNIEDEIERTEKELERVSGKVSERYDAFAAQREADRQQEEVSRKQRTLPGFERKAGVRPVEEAALKTALTKLVNLRNEEESLRRAIADQAGDPTRYLRQVAVQKQEELDIHRVETDQTAGMAPELIKILSVQHPQKKQETPADKAYYQQLERDIKKFNNLVKGKNVKAVRAALQQTLVQQEKVQAEINKLKSRARAYEQQQAVIAGEAPGTAEAKRLTEGKGYKNVYGNVRTEPKKLSSWGLKPVAKTKQTLSPTNKVEKAHTAVVEAQKTFAQPVRDLGSLAESTEIKRNNLQKEIAKASERYKQLEGTLKQVYPENVATATDEELSKLRTALDAAHPEVADNFKNVEKAYKDVAPDKFNALITDTNKKVVEAAADITFAETEVSKLYQAVQDAQAKHDAIYAAPYTGTTAAKLSNAQFKIDQAFDKYSDFLSGEHRETQQKYMVARAEQLTLLKTFGNDLRQTLIQEGEKLAGLTAQMPALNAKINELVRTQKGMQKKLDDAAEKLQAERRAKLLAEEEATTSDAAERAALQRAREGLGLPGVRREIDTTAKLAQAASTNARKMLGIAEKELADARKSGDPVAVRRATLRVQDFERQVQQVQELGERVTTPIEPGEAVAREATQPVAPGTRSARRREGPVVRTSKQAPSQFVTGTPESREAIGKGNRPTQAGAVRLRTFDLSVDAANAISLATLKKQLSAAKGKRKDELEEKYKEATTNLSKSEIDARVAEGERLLGSGPTLAIIAQRENLREVQADIRAAATRLDEAEQASDAARIALAQSDFDAAVDARDRIEKRIDDMMRAHEREKLKATMPTATEEAAEAVTQDLEGAPVTRAEQAVGDVYNELEPVQYSTATRTMVDLPTEEALLDGRLLDALDSLSKASENPLIRKNAEALRPFVLRTKVAFDPNLTDKGEPIPAAYDPRTNTVIFRPAELSEEDIIHEVTHAATMRALEMPDAELTPDQRKAKQELAAMHAQVQKDPKFEGQYARKNLKEFVSEVQSNAEFRALLDKKPWYLRMFSALMRLVGIKTTSEQASKLVEQLYLPSKKISAPVAAASATQAASPLDALAGKIIAQPKTFKERMGNNVALEAEMQGVDMRAGLREVLKHGDDKLFEQAMYNVLKADQKLPQVFTVMNSGPLEFYKDEKGFYGVRSTNKNSGKDVLKAIADVPRDTPQAKVNLATSYLAAHRALNKGVSRLDTGALGVTEEELQAVMNQVNADPALKAALENVRNKYNAYNEGLINFAAESGAIPKALAAKLLREGDYVPFYRVRDNGMAELVFSDDVSVSIGDIKNQPYLNALKGGEEKLMPLNESLYRNTLLLTDMALTNMAKKSVAYGLQAMGKGKGEVNTITGKPGDKMAIRKGDGPASNKVFRFNSEPDLNDPKDNGKRWIEIDTKGTLAEGVPAELVVKSMEGAHLPLPAFLKMASAFSDVLRSGVTRMPPYILRQLIRDPMASSFTAGLNYGPLRAVAKAGREFIRQYQGSSATAAKLIEKGLIQSGIFTGDADDVSKIALQMADERDQSTLNKVFAAMDKAAMRADASTRVLVYENAIANGLSEVQADMMTMESMNFYKRGLNPVVQYGNRLIPFLNAQIQGLNVLYKAAKGQMPYQEQLDIKRKFFNNAVFLFGTGLLYAMAMDDDKTFKNARPRDKYTNFFLHLPGVDEPVKIPTPFEAGYFFSLAVAAVDAMKAETNTQEQWEAVRDMFLQSIPGWSSSGLPQMVKPVYEVWMNKNTFSGAPIESARMENLDITQRYNSNTTEFAKQLSKALPLLSPVQIEHLTRAYLGVGPLAAFAAANQLFAPAGKGEAPEMRASDLPFFGGMFQKTYGGADSDTMYRLAKASEQARNTYNSMRKEGRPDEAKEFFERHRAEIQSAQAAGQYQQAIGRINLDMRRLESRNDLTAAQKAVRREELEKAKQDTADRFLKRFNLIANRA